MAQHSKPWPWEICFPTEGGRICLPIATAPIPFVPSTDLPQPPTGWSMSTARDGSLRRASQRSEGVDRAVSVTVERGKRAATEWLVYSESGAEVVRIGGRVEEKRSNSWCVGAVSILGKARDWEFSLRAESSSCSEMEFVRTLNGEEVEVRVDLDRPEDIPTLAGLGLCGSAPAAVVKSLEQIAPVLAYHGEHRMTTLRRDIIELLDTLSLAGDGDVAAGWGCMLYKVGCSALVGGATAYCCGQTALVGCVACTAGGSSALLLCSEVC